MTCANCAYTSPANTFCLKQGMILCLNCAAEMRYFQAQQPKRAPGRPPKYTVEGLLRELGSRIKPDPCFFQLPEREQVKILRRKLAETASPAPEIPAAS